MYSEPRVTLFHCNVSNRILEPFEKLHHGEPKYICDICEHKCFTKTNLNNHMQKHKCEEHRCDECDYVTYTAKLLDGHKLNKHMVKPFKCDFCEHRVSKKPELLDHIRHHHTMERPFKCDQCEMAFSNTRKLKRHKVGFSSCMGHAAWLIGNII